MSRLLKFLSIFIAVVFVLACNLVTQPINDVKNLASTAESIATAMPVETLKALPSAFPSVEALASEMPTFTAMFDPKGKPVANWNDIPIMPQATVGDEFGSNNYSYKAPVSLTDVQTFYTEQMKTLGWNQTLNMPSGSDVLLLVYQKDNHFLSITVTPQDNEALVLLNLQ